jgi:hypothetical protein
MNVLYVNKQEFSASSFKLTKVILVYVFAMFKKLFHFLIEYATTGLLLE